MNPADHNRAAMGADGEMTLDLVKAWRNAYWDGPFQDAKNRLCDFVIAAMTEREI